MAPSAPIHRVKHDANVFYPASLRDLLLRCAEKELDCLHLSQDIWTEVVRVGAAVQHRHPVAASREVARQVVGLDEAWTSDCGTDFAARPLLQRPHGCGQSRRGNTSYGLRGKEFVP